jgi:DNA-binding NarL/FixJ family response regulator
MSTATARWPQPATAAVLGGDGIARRQVARLLAESGFSVGAASPAALVILLGHASDATRGRELRELHERHPDASILAIMPAGSSNASLRRALLAGAAAIALDDDLERTLVPTARAMLAGQLAVPTTLSRQIAPRPLSHREKQILALVVVGRTNREIAHKLFLAESTVKTHLSSAFRKLDARSRSEAVARITDPENGYGPSILEIAGDSVAAAG